MGASPHPSSDKVVSLAALVVGGRWRVGYGGSEGEGRSDSQGLSGSYAEDDHDGTTSAMSKLGTSESAQGKSRVGFVGKRACRMLGRRIFLGGKGGSGRESIWTDKISEEGAKSDVRKRDRGAGRPGGEIRPHLFSVSCSPCFHSWLPVEIPGMCMGRLEQAVSMTCLI